MLERGENRDEKFSIVSIGAEFVMINFTAGVVSVRKQCDGYKEVGVKVVTSGTCKIKKVNVGT